MPKPKVLLSFDLSTTVIGYSIFNLDEKKKLIEINFYKYTSENMLEKARELENFVFSLQGQYNIQLFCIEERLKSFRAGGTNAESMIKNNQMNFFCQYIFFQKCIEIKEISVNTARKLSFPGFHSAARKIKGIKQKEIAFEYAVKELPDGTFPKKTLKSGIRRGQIVFLDEARDMADSYILGKSCLILKNL